MSSKQAPMTLIEDQSALKTAIESHGKKRANIDKETQRLALSAIAVFAQHGNVFYINHLYANMGKGARHKALTEWLFAFGGVKANEDKESAGKKPFVKDAEKTVDMAGAAKEYWYNFAPSKSPADVIDVLKLTLAVIKKASRKDAQLEHGEMLEKLQALAAEFGTEEEAEEAAEG